MASIKKLTPEEIQELAAKLNKEQLPKHIGIIMDGNGRWAKNKNLSRIHGHRAGMEAARRTIEAGIAFGIPFLTLYAFSTENWQRPLQEVNYLMDLLKDFLNTHSEEMQKQNVKVRVLGDLSRLEKSIQDSLKQIEKNTQDANQLTLSLAINYGGRQEIIYAVKEIIDQVQQGTLLKEQIDEQLFCNYLDTQGLEDPDFIIRTSGEMRISNFFLWQIAYAELYFTDVLWPNFDARELYKALVEFSKRERRKGKII